ncbi:MAG: hypothetical protein ACP5NQ_06030, partial [Vulcanisaeta sp.]
ALNALNNASKNINGAYNLLIESLSTVESVSDKPRRVFESTINLIMGYRLPSPAITEGITGSILTCNDASLRNNIVEFKCRSKDTSRDDLLRTLPFKYYE